MRFAIRDDDTSFFTRPEELDNLWGPFLPHVPISLAVVPVTLQPFHLGDPRLFYQGQQQHDLRENRDLVAWLRTQVGKGSVAVMCHGYSHEYRRTGPCHLEQEYIWKPFDRLRQETMEGKRLLESTIGSPITTSSTPCMRHKSDNAFRICLLFSCFSVSSPWAVNSNGSHMASPMRFSPKSIPSILIFFSGEVPPLRIARGDRPKFPAVFAPRSSLKHPE